MAKKKAPPAGPPSAEAQAAYEEAVRRLVERLRAMARNTWSPTPEKKAAQALAERLRALADELDSAGPVAEMIEDFHAREWGDDGARFKAAVLAITELSRSAEGAALELPDPRKRHVLRFAAEVFAHLTAWHKGRPPALTLEGPDMAELERITRLAGIYRDRETLKGPMAEAIKAFRAEGDPLPHFLREFLP